MTSNEQSEKEEVAKLLRFESSRKPAGDTVSLADYVRGMANTQRDIFYLAAPTRYLTTFVFLCVMQLFLRRSREVVSVGLLSYF